jgi:hypothetical protein
VFAQYALGTGEVVAPNPLACALGDILARGWRLRINNAAYW